VQAVGAEREFDIARLIPLMVGRSLDHQFPPRTPRRMGPPVLEARGLSRAGVVRNVSLQLRQGEILGIAGLMGAGRSELARMIFGLDARDAGEVFIGGQRLPPRSPRASVARGLAFASEDRRHEGLLLDATIADNMSLASLERFATSPLRRIDHQRIAAAADELVSRLSISCRDVRRQAVRTLSGGNQQKVVLARWLMRDAQVLLLDEPTRGVDVGSRQHVYELIRQAAARGAGVLLISSEIEELLGMCDRILVLSAGAVQAEFEREDFNRDTLMAAAFAAVRGRYS
jgi:ribose transport system ATP-binding protein